jgi:hypothetical protein
MWCRILEDLILLFQAYGALDNTTKESENIFSRIRRIKECLESKKVIILKRSAYCIEFHAEQLGTVFFPAVCR